MLNIKNWQLDHLILKGVQMFLIEDSVNEMDPNIILMRLGKIDTDAASITNSTPLTSVNHGDKFMISYLRKDF